ncbi:MAG: beta-xylosidase [Williamsia sp.]|nr:beta-xylosidase [Williamsia sp.]
MKTFLILIVSLLSTSLFAQKQKSINITVDVSQKGDSMLPLWAFFGYDEPNYTYMKDGRKLLSEIASFSPIPVYVRTHNLLTTGDGEPALKWGSNNAYTEDSSGNPVYNWRLTDSIFQTYLDRGMKPIAEIGFMPEALSSHPQPYRHHWKPGDNYNDIYTGWAYPPTDYTKWGELVYQWVKHCVDKWGEREVNSWYWEVWNEPNIGYWKGTFDEYCKLYDYAADAVKRAAPGTRIGGPTSTGPNWDKAEDFLRRFLQHCAGETNYATGKKGAPLDYITFHAKGSPKVVGGHVQMNMSPQLNDIIKGCKVVTASPFKSLPIMLGECDPEGCAACGMSTNPENAYRNGTMYASYTAASFARIYEIRKQTGANLIGAVSWSFEFEDQPPFFGFRDLATNGINKPVLNVFRMYGMMKGHFVKTTNDAQIPYDTIVAHSVRGGNRDIGSLAAADDSTVSLMLWNYADDDVPAAPQPVTISFSGLPGKNYTATLYRVDSTHSNAYTAWKDMGSPGVINDGQYMVLQAASRLKGEEMAKGKSKNEMKILLPAQGVYLVRLVRRK